MVHLLQWKNQHRHILLPRVPLSTCLTLRFGLGVTHPAGLGKGLMARVLCSITRSFLCPENPLCSPCSSPLPPGNGRPSNRLRGFTFSSISRTWGLVVCSLSCWLLALRYMHLSFFHDLQDWVGHFTLGLNSISRSGWTTLPVQPLKNILVVSKFQKLWTKSL